MDKLKKNSFVSRLKETNPKFYAETIIVQENHENENFKNLFFSGCDLKGNSFKNSSFNNLTLKSCSFSDFDFQNAHFQESFGKHYLFQNCNFQDASFSGCDFSGGAFDKINLSYAHFEHCDFALCEFNDVNFEGSKFFDCNFNASFFENSKFGKCEFHDSTFNYIEGLTSQEIKDMKNSGAQICPPVEIQLKSSIIKVFKKLHPFIKFILFAALFAVLGYNARFLISKAAFIFQVDSNPLSYPVNFIKDASHTSFFYNRLSLPNYNFSDNMDHWLTLPESTDNKMEKSGINIEYKDFVSFPSSISFNSFKGKLFYIKTLKSSNQYKDPLENPKIWLPVDYKGEKLKFSFYFKRGHPKFNIYGKFKNGGFKTLAEIDSNMTDESEQWKYYSEELPIPAGFSSICLKISSFPKIKFYMDDINIENSI